MNSEEIKTNDDVNTGDTRPNLKPFTGASDPRRQNGRKKGSKNISTIVNELLTEDIDISFVNDGRLRQYIERMNGGNNSGNAPISYAKAISLSMIIKALNGDVRASTWVTEQNSKASDEDSFFKQTEIIFNVVPPKHEIEK